MIFMSETSQKWKLLLLLRSQEKGRGSPEIRNRTQKSASKQKIEKERSFFFSSLCRTTDSVSSTMTADGNSYEEVRRRRIQENLKQLEDLGIAQISKSLLEVAKRECKILKCSSASPKPKKNLQIVELRRSSRARNLVPSYRDEVVELELRSYRKRFCRSEQNGRAYTGRVASYEEQVRAIQKAQNIQSNLSSDHPSFVKAMVRSHVSSCFWLGLPTRFCKEHLPSGEEKMVLEDENGSTCYAIYIGSRTGLSGGWRGFALEHNLEDGDALVFELVKPDRFKIYIVKAVEDNDTCDEIDHVDSNAITKLSKEEENVGSADIQSSPKTGGRNRGKRRKQY